MSKIYLAITVMFISHFSQAQITKGSYLIGGQLSYSNSKSESGNIEQKSSSGNFSLSLGRAFKENKIAGIMFKYAPSKQFNYSNGVDTFNAKTNQFDLGVFYRQYKLIFTDFYFFAQVEAAYSTALQKYNYNTVSDGTEFNRNGGYLSITPGLSYALFKKFQIELTFPNLLGVGYFVTKMKSSNLQPNDYKKKEFSAYSSLSYNSQQGWLGIGFRFVI